MNSTHSTSLAKECLDFYKEIIIEIADLIRRNKIVQAVQEFSQLPREKQISILSSVICNLLSEGLTVVTNLLSFLRKYSVKYYCVELLFAGLDKLTDLLEAHVDKVPVIVGCALLAYTVLNDVLQFLRDFSLDLLIKRVVLLIAKVTGTTAVALPLMF